MFRFCSSQTSPSKNRWFARESKHRAKEPGAPRTDCMDSSCISFELQKDDQLWQQQLGFTILKNIENLQLYYSTCRTAAGLELHSSPDDELVVNELVEDNALHQRANVDEAVTINVGNAVEAIRLTCKGPSWSVIHYLVLEQGEKKGNIHSDDPVYDV